MPHSTVHKLRNIPVLGDEHVPADGVLVIPSQLSYHDLLHLEKMFEGRPIVLLTEQNAVLHPLLKSHLQSETTQALEFDSAESNLKDLRKGLEDHIAKKSVIIYVPAEAATQQASLTTIPGSRLEYLMQAAVPVLPLYVLHTNDTVLAIEPLKDEASAIFAFGKVLKNDEITVARYLESLFVLGEACFAQNPMLDRHLAYALLQGLKRHSTHASLIDGKDESEWRFDKILAAAIALSKHIKAITDKQRVGIILPPGFGATVANLGVLFAGKIPVNLNFTAGRESVDSAIRQGELDHYITADLFVRKMQSFPWPPNRQLTFIERLLPEMKAAITKWYILAKLLPTPLLALILGIPKKGGNKEAVLLFTSGSSGEPKGVALTHRNLIANVCQFGSRLNMKSSDRIMGCLPLFHSFGCTVTLWYPIIQGISLVTYPTPLETKKLAELIQKYKVSLMVSTPTFLRGYLKGINPEMLVSLKLMVTGAEKLQKTIADAFEARFGKRVFEGYGLTETSPVSNVNLPDPGPENGGLSMPSYRFGSVGQLLPGLAIRITDPDTDAPLPITQSGMVWFKGDNVFKGYLKNPKKTEEVIQHEWFRTGDIGRVDADGFLYIEGRLSRFSKIGGEMVPHETVEEAIVKAMGLENESTRRIVVVGVPDPDKGEALVLLTSISSGSAQQDILDLRYKLLDRGLPPLWIPKKLVPVADIPVLATGKLDLKGCEKLAMTAGW